MFKKTWAVVTIGLLLVMINTVADGIFIGRFLGEDCIAALGLATPIILFGNLIASLISQGTNLLCAKYVGMADQKKLCEVFSTSCIFALLISLPAIGLCYAFTPQIADFLSGNREIYSLHIANYLYGYWPLLCLICFSMMFGGLMRLDNDFGRGIAASFIFTVSNCLLDYVSVICDGGMLGMALASTGAAVLSLSVFPAHFFKKNALLRFSFRYFRPSHIVSVFKFGFSSTISTASVIVRTFVLNFILLSSSVSGAVAAFSVIQSVSAFFTILIIAITMAVSTVAGTLFGEGDRSGLKKLFGISMKFGFKVSFVLTAILLIFAENLAGLYVGGNEEVLNIATEGLRLFSLSLVFVMVFSSVSGYYISTDKVKENYLLVLAGQCIFPVASARLLYNVIGIDGIWISFAVGALGGTLLIPIFSWLYRNNRAPGFKNILLLDENFGARQEDIYEKTVGSLEEVINASKEAQTFCENKKSDPKAAMAIALSIEEIAKNILSYGFKPNGKNIIEIRLLCTGDRRILRIRDDCLPFDPVKWFEMNRSENVESNLGIRMVMGMAEDVQYLPMWGINQLIIKV